MWTQNRPSGGKEGGFILWVLFCLPLSKFPAQNVSLPHLWVLPPAWEFPGAGAPPGCFSGQPGLFLLANMWLLFCLSTWPFWVVVGQPLPSALEVVLLGEMVPRMPPTLGCCHFHSLRPGAQSVRGSDSSTERGWGGEISQVSLEASSVRAWPARPAHFRLRPASQTPAWPWDALAAFLGAEWPCHDRRLCLRELCLRHLCFSLG